ncbi:adenosylhomocysteinase [Halovenus rubra]|uniref:Adenosylhomocysteinase n=2 Tax=Halovenus rubra TaxID=869890 RepID=A0ACC7DW43_9EURY|nr:adenosylhomocysteinase [Halovenus rubra]
MSNATDWGPLGAVRKQSPLLRAAADRYRETTPFENLTVGVSAPMTPHTGLFLDVLATGGAKVLATGEAGSTHAAVVEWLQERPRITPLAATEHSRHERRDARREVLAAEPDLIADDGANLLSLVHDEFPDVAEGLRGACEQTTGGITRLQAMDNQDVLACPVYDVNGTPMKQHFDNVHGTAESSLSAITSLTDTLLAGSVAVVAGYGHCGRGIARKLRALGARTVVTEVDPRKALEALADGHDVRPMAEAVTEAEFVITATGRYQVLRDEHVDALADGTVIASIGSAVEVDREALASHATDSDQPRPGTTRYRFPDGREVTLLTDGKVVNLTAPNSTGNPGEVMDTTFAMMIRGLVALADGVSLEPGLHPVPDDLDRAVAHEKLAAMAVEIDDIPDKQRAFHSEWAFHDSSAVE